MEKNIKEMATEKQSKRWIRKIWGSVPIIGLLILVIVLAGAIGDKKAKLDEAKASSMRKGSPPVNVVTMVVNPRVIKDRINLPGIVKPWVDLNILSEVRGRVMEKRAREGATIEKNHIIAVLDKRDYENALKSAKASYDEALASKKRLEKLYASQLATKAQLDDITAKTEMARAGMDNAALSLNRCTIRSPIHGILNKLFFEKGQYINQGEKLAQVIRIDKVKVNLGIPESDVTGVRKVERFQVKIDALGGKIFQARKNFLAKTTNSMAKLYDLELRVDNPGLEILPGMFARVEIVKKEIDDALAVPLYSVISFKKKKMIYVAMDGSVKSRNVKLGLQENWIVQVTKGISQGEQVVVMGQRNVSDGQKVNVVKTITSIGEMDK